MRRLSGTILAAIGVLSIAALMACTSAAPQPTAAPAKPAAPTAAAAPAAPPTAAKAAEPTKAAAPAPTAAPTKAPTGPPAAAKPSLGPDGKLARLPDGFPAGPLTFWSAQVPGHADELYARTLAQAAQKFSPVPIVVQSKSAGPSLWWETMDHWKTLPNGTEGYHFLVLGYSAVPIRFHSVGVSGWTLEDTYKGILLGTESENQVLAAKWDAPWKDVQEFIKYAKENSGKARIAISAVGSLVHLNAEILASEQGFKFINVPHEGLGQAQQTVLGGGAEAVATLVSQVTPVVEGKRLRVLLHFGETPSKGLPDAPATGQLKWGGMGTSRGVGTFPTVPEPRKAWLRALLEMGAKDPVYQERLDKLGLNEYLKPAEVVAEDLRTVDRATTPILKQINLYKQ